ncbi:hypothetical protein IM660_04930 [Ruania alkalisoli]|uniref:Right-handed parallel beta-helix repeat-containing protein n=1 Tax=Ruania alkalisoli TaxID=2779775 RepID=A0A7M1SXF3_9MICO|nr:hypothetical protein [Ruania alkalisoli]QOR71634.1 hypothetical protein IM660_04930 [Ruania alkalisoli]
MSLSMDRRRFLTVAGATGAGALLLPTAAMAAEPAPPSEPLGPLLRGEDGRPLMFKKHGLYSHDYKRSWHDLPTGDVLAAHDPGTIEWTDVIGEEFRQEFHDQDEVVIRDLNLRLRWNTSNVAKWDKSLFYISNVKRIVVENVNIESLDPDFRTWSDFLIEGADEVIFRNCYFAGATRSYHLRIEAVANVFVDRVEIAGLDGVDGDGVPYRGRTGAGIWLENGQSGREDGDPNNPSLSAEHPRDPQWAVIQNCYFHNGIDVPIGGNRDALLAHHYPDGAVFNNVVRNWFRDDMDAGFDLGARRKEDFLQGKTMRVERNILENVSFYKNPAFLETDCRLLWTNNLLINTKLDFYASDQEVNHIHNTYIQDLDAFASDDIRSLAARGATSYHWKFGATGGCTFNLENGLTVFRTGGGFSPWYANTSSDPEKVIETARPDHMVYGVGGMHSQWLKHDVAGWGYDTFEDWQAGTGFDASSVVEDPQTEWFVDYAGKDFRLVENLWPDVPSHDYLHHPEIAMRITRDFNGRPRTMGNLAPGAFNAI